MTTRQKILSGDARDRPAPAIDRAEALLIFVVVLALGACGWVANAITPTQAATSVGAAANVQSAEQPDYFPSADVNHALEIPEHIQAF